MKNLSKKSSDYIFENSVQVKSSHARPPRRSGRATFNHAVVVFYRARSAHMPPRVNVLTDARYAQLKRARTRV